MRVKDIFASLLIGAFLVGCAGGGSSGSGDDDDTSISISGVNTARVIAPKDGEDVAISGIDVDVTIRANSKLGRLSISGVDTVVTIHDGTTIDKFVISGIDTTVFTDETYVISGSGVGTVISPIP